MLQAVVCDDIAYDRKLLKRKLEHLKMDHPEKINVTEYDSAKTLLSDLEEGFEKVDVIFMDIFMDGMSGMEAARKLRELGFNIPVIFTTASADYAVEGYDVQASGYLLKPLDNERLELLVKRLFARIERPRIVLRIKGENRYFYKDEIMWLESNNKIVTIHFSDKHTIIVREKLNTLEELLNDERFLRCHHSFLINMDYVSDADNEFIMTDGSKVPIRVRERKAIKDTYYHYFIGHALNDKNGEKSLCMR